MKTDGIFVSFQLIALLVRHHRKKLPECDHMVPEKLTEEVSHCVLTESYHYIFCAIETDSQNCVWTESYH